MFDKFKQMAQLKALQDEAKKQRYEGNINGVKVLVDGRMNILEVNLNPELSLEDQARAVKDAANSAMASAQQGMAAKLQGMM